jgi:hypothetical protein
MVRGKKDEKKPEQEMKSCGDLCRHFAEEKRASKQYEQGEYLIRKATFMDYMDQHPKYLDNAAAFYKEQVEQEAKKEEDEKMRREALLLGRRPWANKYNLLSDKEWFPLSVASGLSPTYSREMLTGASQKLVANMLLNTEHGSALHKTGMHELVQWATEQVALSALLLHAYGGSQGLQDAYPLDGGEIKIFQSDPTTCRLSMFPNDPNDLAAKLVGAFRFGGFTGSFQNPTDADRFKTITHLATNKPATIPTYLNIGMGCSVMYAFHTMRAEVYYPGGEKAFKVATIDTFKKPPAATGSKKRARDESDLPALEFLNEISRGGKGTGKKTPRTGGSGATASTMAPSSGQVSNAGSRRTSAYPSPQRGSPQAQQSGAAAGGEAEQSPAVKPQNGNSDDELPPSLE